MAAFRSVIGLASRAACSECCRHLSLTSLLDASRHLKQSTAFSRAARTIGKVDNKVDKELKRIERLKAKRERRNVLAAFYKNSLVLNKQFKVELAEVMAGIPELVGKRLVLTKTQANVDFTHVKVFWSTKEVDNEEDLSRIISEREDWIVEETRQRLGDLPKIEFLHDVSYSCAERIEKVMSRVVQDIGQLDTDTMDQIYSLADNGRDKRVMRKKRPTTLVEPDNAEQTIDQEQTAIFAADYIKSMEEDGKEKKKELQRKIKKFLRERKKQVPTNEN